VTFLIFAFLYTQSIFFQTSHKAVILERSATQIYRLIEGFGAEVLRLRATSAMSGDKSVRRFAQDDDSVGGPEEKPQVPPLRFAPVGMTNSFKGR
jgi:hypothetical protein